MSNELSEIAGDPVRANNGVDVIVSGSLLVIRPHGEGSTLTAVLSHKAAHSVVHQLSAAHNLAPHLPAQPSAAALPDRYVLGDAIRRAWLEHGSDSWCLIADDVLAELATQSAKTEDTP